MAARDDDWQRPPPTSAEQRLDLLGAAALAAGVLVSTELARSAGMQYGPGPLPSVLEQTLWGLAVSLPLALRRRAPLVVLALVSAVYIGLQARYVPEYTITSVCLFTALFSAGAWGQDRRATTVVKGVVVVSMFCWLGISVSLTAYGEDIADGEQTGLLPPETASLIYATVANALYFALAWVLGDRAWRAARGSHALHQRTQDLAESRAEVARQAVLAERVRIARELHDVVAHHVSVSGVQAAAARRALKLAPDKAETALAAVEQSSRAAVGDLHRLLGALRSGEGDGPDPAPPGLNRLGSLVDQVRDSGLDVDLRVVPLPRHGDAGTPRAGDATAPLGTSVQVAAYRVVQEALTNVVKHAGARHAVVSVRYEQDALEVEVTDDGQGTPGAKGSGLGHLGMRERVALHGGNLDVGPRTTGGYRVRARFPLSTP